MNNNSIIEMSSNELIERISLSEHLLKVISRNRDRKRLIRQIRRIQRELGQRSHDSLYVTNSNGTVELVDDMGEIK